MEPDPELIDSMALRYRHDFGLLDLAEKQSIRTTMRQLLEEVIGEGFYRGTPYKRATPEPSGEEIYVIVDFSTHPNPVFVEIEHEDGSGVCVPCKPYTDGLHRVGPLYVHPSADSRDGGGGE